MEMPSGAQRSARHEEVCECSWSYSFNHKIVINIRIGKAGASENRHLITVLRRFDLIKENSVKFNTFQ